MPDYDEWINRERRIRLKTLKESPVISKTKIYRVCRGCGEVCLCHEMRCPNCNSEVIQEQFIKELECELDRRMRCAYRFEHLG